MGPAEFSVLCSRVAEKEHSCRGESRRSGGGRAAGKDPRAQGHNKA